MVKYQINVIFKTNVILILLRIYTMGPPILLVRLPSGALIKKQYRIKLMAILMKFITSPPGLRSYSLILILSLQI